MRALSCTYFLVRTAKCAHVSECGSTTGPMIQLCLPHVCVCGNISCTLSAAAPHSPPLLPSTRTPEYGCPHSQDAHLFEVRARLAKWIWRQHGAKRSGQNDTHTHTHCDGRTTIYAIMRSAMSACVEVWRCLMRWVRVCLKAYICLTPGINCIWNTIYGRQSCWWWWWLKGTYTKISGPQLLSIVR